MYARLVNELRRHQDQGHQRLQGPAREFQAVERGELDGLFMSGWSGPGRAYVRDQIEPRPDAAAGADGAARAIPSTTTRRRCSISCRRREDRAIVELQLDRVALGRPVIGPPGVPADRVAMLRAAFNMAVADPDFLKEAALQRLAIDPMNGDDAEQLINRLYRTPAPVLERMRKIVQVTAVAQIPKAGTDFRMISFKHACASSLARASDAIIDTRIR